MEREFFGKTCNYAFPYREKGYSVFFLGDGYMESEANFDNIDSCILWAAYQEFVEESTNIGSENALICEADSGHPVMWFSSQDSLLECVWMTLTDVNIDEKERTEQDWFIFPVGTCREEIWEWFDRYYSEGVGMLMNSEVVCPVLPWMDTEEKGVEDNERTFPWIFVTEDGVTDQEARARALKTGVALVDIGLWLDETDNAAFLSARIPEEGDEEQITAALYEDYLKRGEYLLDIYDNEELLHTEDTINFHAGGIREAAQIASLMILNAINDQKERIKSIQKRYLQQKA